MIYLFCGDDVKNKRSSYEKFLKSMPVGMETFLSAKMTLILFKRKVFIQDLDFFTKCTIVFTNTFEKEETLDFVLEKLNLMGESVNNFVF